MSSPRRPVTVVLCDGFEVLDVFGPVELFGRLPEEYPVTFVAPVAGPVRSSQGVEVIATAALDDGIPTDILLVPGGIGTRALVDDHAFLERLTAHATHASLITSVCTGSGLLAAAGLLDGYRATSNKRAFAWASSQGADVTWVPHARWVHDRDRWTSGGVAAGMDMTAALIAHLSGTDTATTIVRDIELEVHTDPDWDPFATFHGLDDHERR